VRHSNGLAFEFMSVRSHMSVQVQHGFEGSTRSARWLDLEDFPPPMKKSAAPRVLVVDDESLVRWSLVETLLGHGYEVAEAVDGRSAIGALSGEGDPVEGVLLDLRLPDCNDLHVLSKVRQLVPGASIILMTAYGTADLLDDALRIGAYVVLHKPFDLNGIHP